MKPPSRRKSTRKESDEDLVLTPAGDEERPVRRIREPAEDVAPEEDSTRGRPARHKGDAEHASPRKRSQRGESATRADESDPSRPKEPPSVRPRNRVTAAPPQHEEILPAEVVSDASGAPVEDLDSQEPVVFRRVGDFAAAQTFRHESEGVLEPHDARVRESQGRVKVFDVGAVSRREVASQDEPAIPQLVGDSWRLSDLVVQGPPLPLLLFTLLLILIALAI